MTDTKIIKIFVSHPEDVKAEVDSLYKITNEVNRTYGKWFNVRLEILEWKNNCTPGPGAPQNIIDADIGDPNKYDIYFGIMWKRYGELTPEGVSGTEGEFWKAYTSWISNKKPLPLFIFNQTPYTLSSQDELSQLNKVIDFKNKIKDKVFIGHYPNSEQFADIVRPILIEKIFDLTIGNGSSEKDKSKIDPLIGALKDKDMQVQNYAIDTLDIFNTDDILPSLITALNDKNPNVRKNVASTLGNKGDKRAVMPLIGLINDPDKTVRRNVVQALGNLCDNRAVPQLIKSLEDKDKTVRRRAALALGKIGDIQAFESLIKALNKEQKSNRVFAIRALSMLRDRRAINYLLPYLDDDNDYFRKVIADAIIHIDPSYQYAINKMLKSNDQFIVSTSLNPITLKLSADPNTILVGGDKSIIIAQLYYNKQPYMMPNVQIKLSLNNNAIATLLKTKSLLTDKNGRVEISLSSNDISGHVIIRADAVLENNIKISDILEINIVEWGTISGEVLDNNLNGIPNAAITLWNSESVNGGYVIKSIIRIPENPQLSNDGRTSSIGQFIYRRVPLGTYILTAEKNGYKGKAIVNLKNKSIKNNLVLNI